MKTHNMRSLTMNTPENYERSTKDGTLSRSLDHKNSSSSKDLNDVDDIETAYSLLVEIGVPFDVDGEPIGIGCCY